jgi:hypothetical protein
MIWPTDASDFDSAGHIPKCDLANCDRHSSARIRKNPPILCAQEPGDAIGQGERLDVSSRLFQQLADSFERSCRLFPTAAPRDALESD